MIPLREIRISVLRFAGACLAGLLLAEGAAWLALSVFHRVPMTWFILAAMRQDVARGSDVSLPADPADADSRRPEYVGQHMLHPYLGFVWNQTAGSGEELNGFFARTEELLAPRDPSTVRVAVMGGSVAAQVYRDAGSVLAAELGRIPAYRGREVQLFPVSMGGFKQPQQLLALTYLLSLGAEFDLVVELDGFNEIALPMTENIPKGIFPHYPRGWQYFARGTDPEWQALVGEVQYLRRQRLGWAARFEAPVLRSSMMGGFLWQAFDGWYRSKILRRIDLLAEHDARGMGDAITGPVRAYASTGAILADLAREWARSSLQMDRIARAEGMEYVHFLQPNQYVPGSKPVMGAEERATAIVPGGYGRWIPMGYPALREAAKSLTAAGVRFHDLTGIFQDEPGRMYVDSCCHLTVPGYGRLAHAIADAIGNDLVSGPSGARGAR